jgi:hypothetical protein
MFSSKAFNDRQRAAGEKLRIVRREAALGLVYRYASMPQPSEGTGQLGLERLHERCE